MPLKNSIQASRTLGRKIPDRSTGSDHHLSSAMHKLHRDHNQASFNGSVGAFSILGSVNMPDDQNLVDGIQNGLSRTPVRNLMET